MHQKIVGEPLDFNYDTLETHEGKEAFRAKMIAIKAEDLHITKHLCRMSYNETLCRMMMKKTRSIVRLYMVRAFDLMTKDDGGHSDPYLKLELNGTKVNERKNYVEDEPNPDFYQMFEFEAVFPGCSPLSI